MEGSFDFALFGTEVKQIRQNKGFTLQSLSDKSGIAINTINKIESGNMKVRLETLSILSFYLECNLLEILSNTKSKLLNELNNLRISIDECLSNRHYDDVTLVIEKANALHDKIKFDHNDNMIISFFNSLDKIIYWAEGIDLCRNQKKYDDACQSYLEAIKISHPIRDYSDIENYVYANLDQHILASLMAALIENEDLDALLLILPNLYQQVRGNKPMDHLLYASVSYAYGNILFHIGDYEKAMGVADATIKHLNYHNLKTEFCHLYFMKSVCGYQLKLNDKDVIEEALNMYIYEGKEQLIPMIKENLKTRYFIEL